MRVAFDAWPLVRGGPAGRYAREMQAALQQRGLSVVPYALGLRGSDVGALRWRVPQAVLRIAWRRFDAPRIDRLTGPIDVVHATGGALPPANAPGVVTVHDLGFLNEPRRKRAVLQWSLGRAGRVLVPTFAIRDCLARALSLSSDRIIVAPDGVSPECFAATPLAAAALAEMGIREPFVLAAPDRTHDLGPLVAAWLAARPRPAGWSLAVLGPRALRRRLRGVPGAVATGPVAEAALPGLLAAAGLFCCPWRHTEFPSTALQAMAAGTPVVAGDSATASEILKDAAVLVEPSDVDAIQRALTKLATDAPARRLLSSAGRARAAAFTWEAAARMVHRAYEEVL